MMENSRELKDKYHEIVKRLHPDANPGCSQRQQELLLRAIEFYRKGDLDGMRAVYTELSRDGAVPRVEKDADADHLLRELGRLAAFQMRSVRSAVREIRQSELGRDLFGELNVKEQWKEAESFYTRVFRRWLE